MQLDKAVSYAKNGIKVFPCSKDKQPIIRGGNGFNDATTDIRKIKAWWNKHPDAMIGAPNDQFTVIDVDDYNLCPTGKLLTDHAMKRLRETGVVNDSAMRVRTMSGGTHIYFKKNDVTVRSIGCLPNIDLLANGGYVILPDQVNYVADNSSPWEQVKQLPEFDFAQFSYLQDELSEYTKTAKQLKKSLAKQRGHKKPTAQKSGMTTDIGAYISAMQDAEKSGSHVGMIDYDTGEVEFVESQNLYTITEKSFKKFDSSEVIVAKDGRLIEQIELLNSEAIGRLFHNQQIQMMMAKTLGLKNTTVGGRALQRSILPYHIDRNSSMGVRWSADNSHIIVRDFANFYGSKHRHYDYNLVRLYATTKYNANVQRLSPAEFVIWFTRMLYDIGAIDVSTKMKKFYQTTKLTAQEQKVADGILLLDALKSFYDGYSGVTTFADKFSAAWCGVNVNTIGKIKKRLVAKGVIEYAGVYDCGADRRDDGFYKTPLYQIVTTKKLKIDGVVMDKEVRELQERRKQQMQKDTKVDIKVDKKAEKTSDSRTKKDNRPSLCTIYGVQITEEGHRKVENFCKDFDIDTTVLRKNMFMPVLYSTELIPDVVDQSNQMIFANNFELVVDEPNEDGFSPLIAIGDSPMYDHIWGEFNDKYGDLKDDGFEEASPHFVVAYDVDPAQFEDIDYLTKKFNDYVGDLSFHGVRTMYLNVDQMMQIIDGQQPSEV